MVYRVATATRSGGSPPPARSPSTPFPRPPAIPSASQRDRTARCGSPRMLATRSAASPAPITEYTVPTAAAARRHHGGAGRRAVVHRARRQQDRADHDCGRRHQSTRQPRPAAPLGIAAGPDGALWFTERQTPTRSGGSRRRVSSPNTRFQRPTAILPASPRGRTARCGSPRSAGNKIGRITTAGSHHRVYHSHGRQRSQRHRGGAGWRAVVHRGERQQDRADHDRRRHHGIHRYATPAAVPQASRRDRTARFGSPRKPATRSGGSRPGASSPNLSFPRPSANRRASQRGRMARYGSLRVTATRSDGSPPRAASPKPPLLRPTATPMASSRGRTARCGSLRPTTPQDRPPRTANLHAERDCRAGGSRHGDGRRHVSSAVVADGDGDRESRPRLSATGRMDGNVVSTSPSYTFTLAGNFALVANFNRRQQPRLQRRRHERHSAGATPQATLRCG